MEWPNRGYFGRFDALDYVPTKVGVMRIHEALTEQDWALVALYHDKPGVSGDIARSLIQEMQLDATGTDADAAVLGPLDVIFMDAMIAEMDDARETKRRCTGGRRRRC